MPIYEVNINEFSNDDYVLIGIHTTLSEYKLAYLLNQHLHIKFNRAGYDLDFIKKGSQSSYTVYEYTNAKLCQDWFLIANVYKSTLEAESISLFNQSDSITRLIPEKKKVDFFLKLEGDFDYDSIVKIIEVIKQIPQIITSYQIEVNSLKSKDFLIF
ncbi:IPExxxVDY family protein [Tenacibaculum singaporense]|uniref:IPExxxVDY family protein n=1 Tax=Tenacibaculum singaporense TaxID=2358479 RepID=UPI000F68B57D|nr:IPExxxVDY family protein [Tenacibaculum singaporense]RSC95202.1 IPExxxVDY family protein [Tenacibaculum singaporense]